MSGIDATKAAGRRRQSRLRLLDSRELTLVISAAAWLAAPATAGALPQTDYVLSNVSADFGGTRESISGIFTVGAGDEWYAQFNGSTCSACLIGGVVHAIPITGNTIVTDRFQITFTNDFSSVVSIKSTVGAGVTGTDLTGGAVAAGFPLEYTFADASTVLNGTPETITGHFGFDPLTLIQYGADIQLTGGGPYAGSYAYDAEPSAGDFIEAEGPGRFLGISFMNNLSSADDPLASVGILGGPADNAPTGLVCPGAGPCVVPEPSGLAILGAALGLFLLGPWAALRTGICRWS